MKKEMKSPIEALFDENDDSPITLYNEEDEVVEFEQIAVIPVNEKIYAILQPVIMPEGSDPDEALVFALDELEDEEISINLERDDATIDSVFEAYYKLLEESKK